MVPISYPNSKGDITFGFDLLIYPLPVFRVSMADQILFLEFSKDGLTDNMDIFTDGGFANQPVIQ